MGREWLAMIEGSEATETSTSPSTRIVEPNPAEARDADRCAEPPVYALFAARNGRREALYKRLTESSYSHATDAPRGHWPAWHFS
jgi:hypothetical protein